DGTELRFTYLGLERLDFPAMLASLTLPTLGRYEWDYEVVVFPTGSTPTRPGHLVPVWQAHADGVLAKRHYDRDGQLLGEWSYFHRLTTVAPWGPPPDDFPEEKVTRVIEPDGRTTYNYFSTRFDWSYGLPISYRFTDRELENPVNPPAVGLRYLSQIVVDASRRAPEAGPGIFDPPEDPLEATYVRYEADGLPIAPYAPLKSNTRQQQRRTYFFDRLRGTADDPCLLAANGTAPGEYHWTSEVRSDFDGLGHYRRTESDAGVWTHDGSGPVARSLSDEDRRVTLTDFSRASTTYAYDPETGTFGSDHDFSMIPVTAPWVLGVFTGQQVQEGGQANTVDICYEDATGFVTRQRTYTSETIQPARSGNDVIRLLDRDSRGNVLAEKHYGGDGAGLGTGPLCTLSLPSAPDYHQLFGYQHGVRSRSRFVDPSDPGGTAATVLLTEDLDVDWATGRVAAARDAAGVETSYTFDALGRVTGIDPTDDAAYFFSYTPATATQAAKAEVQRRQAQTTLLHSRLVFDGLGRVIEEHRRLPAPGGGDRWSKRVLAYDGQGRKVSESGLQSVSTPPSGFRRTELFYDPLGRLCKERRADGSVTKVWTQGVQTSRQRTDVRTPGGIQGLLRHFFRDAQGRLQSVRELSGPAGEAFYTDYDYDAGGRLELAGIRFNPSGLTETEIEELPQSLGPSTHQLRSFQYDGRGMLLRECHPEKGYRGTGTTGCVEFGSYDAQGRAGTRRDGSNAFEVSFTYDLAGRLTQIRQGAPSHPGHLLKEYFYGRENSGPDLRAAKLFQAKRHNYLPDPATGAETDFVVTETYRYEGPEGRVSHRRTTVHDQRLDSEGSLSFEQSFDYDELGSLGIQAYPECLHSSCATMDRIFQLRYNFRNGFLTGIPGFSSELTYQENGSLFQVFHDNGALDTIERDANWLPRPKRLTVAGPGGTLLWNSGDYAFDGSGNIRSIGADEYSYDLVGRLVQADVFLGATQSFESYTYDAFGNLTSLGPTGNVRSYSIDAGTNRIADPGYGYDEAGNLTTSPAGTFSFGALGMVTTATGTGKYELYLYTADDERIAKIDVQAQPPQAEWTLRGLDMKVLRTYVSQLAIGPRRSSWSWQKDYVYRGSSLLASVTNDPSDPGGQIQHFHLDHLGTPRLATGPTGAVVAEHKYLPYGEELTDASLDGEAMRFTGHERDADPAGWENDLDYMHARFYSPRTARFLSTDPIGGKVGLPQSWNRYSYVLGNPLTLVDPQGLKAKCIDHADENQQTSCQEILLQIAGKDASAVSFQEDGTLVVNASKSQLANNTGLRFLNSLAAGKKLIGVAIDSAATTSRGLQTLSGKQGRIVNVTTTVDRRMAHNPRGQELPRGGFDGYVAVSTDAVNTRIEDPAVGNRPVDLRSLVFHELVENFYMTEVGLQYSPAHNLALGTEQHLRQERPLLKEFAFGGGPYRRAK
ncbi:MAG: hypothetical protein KDD47_08955, partial [Acidobacteria bacterium]|nr:hypothetical protein [Acidobacteriota bacterium]